MKYELERLLLKLIMGTGPESVMDLSILEETLICPICGAPMRDLHTGWEKGIHLDTCAYKQAIDYFDKRYKGLRYINILKYVENQCVSK